MAKPSMLLLTATHAATVGAVYSDAWVEVEAGWDYRDIDAWNSMEGVCSPSSTSRQSPIDIRSATESEELPDFPAHGGNEEDGSCEFDSKLLSALCRARSAARTVQGVLCQILPDYVVCPPSAPKVVSANLISNAHSFEAVVTGQRDLFITWEGKKYYLDQFHYHSPSEHTINGRFYDMEAHHVHKADDGQALVLAVMMDATQDNENSYMKEIWSSFPKNTEDKVSWELQNPYTGFLPNEKSYFKYDGSFTTPPCTEDTNWLMLTTPVQISVDQREYFRRTLTEIDGSQMKFESTVPEGVALPWSLDLGTSNRPVQDLNGRKIQVTAGDGAIAI